MSSASTRGTVSRSRTTASTRSSTRWGGVRASGGAGSKNRGADRSASERGRTMVARGVPAGGHGRVKSFRPGGEVAESARSGRGEQDRASAGPGTLAVLENGTTSAPPSLLRGARRAFLSLGRSKDAMPTAIEVKGLVKRYGPLAAVDGIDFSVPSGTVFSFLGPNGAGKTTTTEILEGLRRRTEGEVRVLDLDPWSEGRELHQRIGVIPQDFRFFEKITPKEAIEYYRTLFGTKVDPTALLQQVELVDKANSRFDTLSGGQKQKMGLALALTNDPEICFLDEPTTGLDPHARRAIWQVIRTLKREGRTVFLTTHYLEEAELLADRVAIIHRGKIIASGSPAEIIRAHGQPARMSVEGSPALAAYLQMNLGASAVVEDGKVSVTLSDKGDALKVLTAIEASGLPWSSFTTTQDTLDDVFVRLVGQMDEGALKTEGTP